MHAPDQHLRLGEAAKIAPGRPSTNCLWRWCRKGVLARSGERIRLQHIRIGGKIFTTPAWLEQFGKALAEADAAHFDLGNQASEPAVARRSPAPSLGPAADGAAPTGFRLGELPTLAGHCRCMRKAGDKPATANRPTRIR